LTARAFQRFFARRLPGRFAHVCSHAEQKKTRSPKFSNVWIVWVD